MKLAMIGLGKMGGNMVRRLVADGHEVVAFDVDADSSKALASELDNVTPVSSLEALINALPQPRAVWLMVPHQFVDESIQSLIDAGLAEGGLTNRWW